VIDIRERRFEIAIERLSPAPNRRFKSRAIEWSSVDGFAIFIRELRSSASCGAINGDAEEATPKEG